jgi:hypothetical protein
VRTRVGGIVAVVQHQDPLEEKEGEEPRAHQRGEGARVVGQQLDRLRQDLEERDRDDHAPAQRDQGRQRMRQAQREIAAREGGQHRQGGQGDRDQLRVHAWRRLFERARG